MVSPVHAFLQAKLDTVYGVSSSGFSAFACKLNQQIVNAQKVLHINFMHSLAR